LKEWLHNFKPNNSQHLKEHIMSFFIAEGLYDVAKTFSQEAGVTCIFFALLSACC